MKQILTALALLSLSPASVAAHEYWIAPETHRAEEGTTLRADLRVGQDFSGEVYPWLRRNVIAASIAFWSFDTRPVSCRSTLFSCRTNSARSTSTMRLT